MCMSKLILFFFFLIGASHCEEDALELTLFEKDKYLSCRELVVMLLKHDDKTIESTLTQTSFLLTGIRMLIYVDMMVNCVNRIDDELVKIIYVDSKRVVKMKGIDEERLAFIKVNYTDYKDMQSYSLNEKQKEVMKQVNKLNPNVKNPFGNFYTEEAMNKRIEAQLERIKNRKNGTTETLDEAQTEPTMNETEFEKEFNVTTIQKATHVIDLDELFAGLFDSNNSTDQGNETEGIASDNTTNENQTDIQAPPAEAQVKKETATETVAKTEVKTEERKSDL